MIALANEFACVVGVAPWPYDSLAVQAVEPLPMTTLAVPLSYRGPVVMADPDGVIVNDGELNSDEL